MKKSAVNFKSVNYPTKEEYVQKPMSNSKIAFKLTSASLAALTLVASLGGCSTTTGGSSPQAYINETSLIKIMRDKSYSLGLRLDLSEDKIELSRGFGHSPIELKLDLKAYNKPIYFSYLSDEGNSIYDINYESKKNNMTYIYGNINAPIYALENNESKDIYCIINRTYEQNENQTITAFEDFINWYNNGLE